MMVQSHSHETGRGREAASPWQIPSAGWRDIFWRVWLEIGNDRVMLVAAGVTFYLLLAMAPAITALISLYGLFSEPAAIARHIDALRGFIPGGAIEVLRGQLIRVTTGGTAFLGLTAFLSITFVLWTTIGGVTALFEAMNVAYEEVERRSFMRRTLLALLFTFVSILAGNFFLGIGIVMPALLSIIGLDEATKWIVRTGSFSGVFFLLAIGIACLYRWGPSRVPAQWRWIAPGTIFAVLAICAVSILFTWYVANFGTYNATYGSLGAVVGMMVWTWITIIVLIVGGELNAEIEHQTEHDTTIGPPTEMGRRGAVVADTLGTCYGSRPEPLPAGTTRHWRP